MPKNCEALVANMSRWYDMEGTGANNDDIHIANQICALSTK